MNLEKLTASIKQHEGCELESYPDRKGIWTIGYGRNLQVMYPGRATYAGIKIMQSTADVWLLEDIHTACVAAMKFKEWEKLDTDARQNAFAEMVFNLGAGKLKHFVHMLDAIFLQRWPAVSDEALDSDWHKDVGHRAETLALMFKTGEFPA